MYRLSAIDAARAGRTERENLRERRLALAGTIHREQIAREMLNPIWSQIGGTSLAIVFTLIKTLESRIAGVLAGLGITGEQAAGVAASKAVSMMEQLPVVGAAFSAVIAIPKLISGLKDKRQAERSADRYKDMQKDATTLLARWKEMADYAQQVLQAAGVKELLIPSDKEVDELLAVMRETRLRYPDWNPWWEAYTKDSEIREYLAAKAKGKKQVAWGLPGARFTGERIEKGQYGTYAGGYIAASTVLMEDLASALASQVASAPKRQPTTTQMMQRAFTAAKPKDAAMGDLLTRNRRLEEV